MSKLAILGGKSMIAPTGVHPQNPWARPSVEEFFKHYTGAQYALFTNNGTSALISGLNAAGVGPGDEVLVVAHTWVASVACVLRCNAIPIFVDVDPETFCMDPQKIPDRITPRTKAIVPVDLYGHPAPLYEIKEIADRHGLVVVEDACQAGGSEINGVKIGNISHMTGFSFSGKPMSGAFGGVLTTNNKDWWQKALLAGQHAVRLRDVIDDENLLRYVDFGGWGDNYRPITDPLPDLYHADARTDHRIRNSDYLTEKLADEDPVITPHVRPGYKHIYHYYTCLTDFDKLGLSRARFLEALRMEGVPNVAYVEYHARYFQHTSNQAACPGPMHLRSVFQEKVYYPKGCPFKCPFGVEPEYRAGDLPVSERLINQEWSIPQPTLSAPNGRPEMQLIVDAIKKVLDNKDALANADADKLVTKY